MTHSLLFLFTVLFSTIQCEDSTSENFVLRAISDTKFCASILSPTENALKKTLEAAFINNVKENTHFDENDHLDLCCRSFYKCNAYKGNEFNYPTEWNVRHCDCEYFFRSCLNKLNTTLSNEIALVHTIKTPKCYANDYPIKKCIKFNTNLESTVPFSKFSNATERDKFLNRCAKYQLDESKTKRVQLFDLAFYEITSTAINAVIQLMDASTMRTTTGELLIEEPRSKMRKSKEEIAIFVLDVTKKLIGAGCTALQTFLVDEMKKPRITEVGEVGNSYHDTLQVVLQAAKLMVINGCSNMEMIMDNSTDICASGGGKTLNIHGGNFSFANNSFANFSIHKKRDAP